ncbi:hypothetical protein FOMPIDRAFT_87524 [Fomitopsis schrenkii]|uniref:Uncharacterized protein n=1 Tax=Fomitopsis schrenkii TaxID=2126942 RepID=S8DNQ3_FOMSC|nr:hypothetical protein FOMPIDRAFT_87524 [Fomitopsis schrenkii]
MATGIEGNLGASTSCSANDVNPGDGTTVLTYDGTSSEDGHASSSLPRSCSTPRLPARTHILTESKFEDDYLHAPLPGTVIPLFRLYPNMLTSFIDVYTVPLLWIPRI